MAVLSPVLLVGAGTGEATCGILYLASYLRRHGLEAYVRLTDADETDEEVTRSLEGLLAHVRPKLVGISLKWFHHLARAQLIAKTIRKLDPKVQIALGGNTATYFCKDLLGWDCVDHVLLGDGEVPLLALCRGDEAPPNVVNRASPSQSLGYVDGTAKADVYYSHFDQLFLSQLDLHSFSGWVAPGKGCGENCLYCGGTRGMQKATFGRAKPFLRPVESVQRDHREIVPRTWQLRYDFAGSTAAFLRSTWEGVDLSRHSTTYFLWGVPPPELAQTLSEHFHRAYMVLDIGCFSEAQRLETMKRGLLKPCPTNRELFEVIERCRAFPNLQLEISGIAGLPFANEATLKEERVLVERVLGLGCTIGYQRLEAQPGALVTEHPERFEMVTEAKSFHEFLDYFSRLDPAQKTVPMVRFEDRALEDAVQRTSDEIDAIVWEAASKRSHFDIDGRTRLLNTSASTQQFELGAWLGRYRVPARVAMEPVTVVRSIDGTGLSCAPALSRRRYSDPLLQQGEEAAALLDVLAAFEKPTSVNTALSQLRKKARFDADSAREVIDHLAAGRFLQRA
jgi:hypothetical protein